MKKDMNQLIESFFAKKENVLTANLLEELVRAQFLLNEDKSYQGVIKTAQGLDVPHKAAREAAGKKIPKEMNVKFSFIPDIPVSELGWSTLQTKEGGASPQRRQLEEYLKNIPGSSFQEKLEKINQFYKSDPEQLEELGFFKTEDKSRAGKIQQIISYLVFLKTLTSIVTNFNAASAGFAFEAFLGVLLGGKQEKANTGTIADLTAPDPAVPGGTVHMSLKLYSERGVHVGGSFTDLALDLAGFGKKAAKPAIRYIIAVKSLDGEGLEMEGEISIYQFDITQENVFNVMYNTENAKSRQCIRLPQAFIDSKGVQTFESLKIVSRQPEEVEEFYSKDIETALGKLLVDENEYNTIMDMLPEIYQKDVWLAGRPGDEPAIGTHEMAISKIKKVLEEIFLSYDITYKGESFSAKDKKAIAAAKKAAKELGEVITKVADRSYAFSKGEQLEAGVISEGKGSGETTNEIAPGVPLATPEASLEFYNATNDKATALRNTLGYLKVKQFGMARTQVIKMMKTTGQGSGEPIGKLIIGKAEIEKLLRKLTNQINEEIFEIFDSLNVLTTNINTYFATGLRDDAAADMAQTASERFNKKTEEVQTKAKETV